MTAEDLLDNYDEELGVGGAQERDWKGIATALFVILMICLMIGIALVVFTPLTKTTHVHPKHLNVSDLRLCRYPFDDFAFIDGSDKSVLIQSWDGFEVVQDGKRKLIIDRERGDMIPSPTRKYYAIMDKAPNMGMNPDNVTYITKVVKRSSRRTYDIGVNQSNSALQAFIWNPSDSEFIFVENNKIYYQKSVQDLPIRVSNGEGNTVDGLFDWVYQEEIFGKKEALWWSPDGNQLAYASYDNHLTKNVTLKSYHRYMAYPMVTNLHYPKTFAKVLPTYNLHIWDKITEQSRQMDVQLKDSISYHYLFTVKWLKIQGSLKLMSVWTNRYQNKISITICDSTTAVCHLEFEYKYQEKQWASFDDFSKMVSYNDSLYFVLPHEIKDNYYQHIVKLRLAGNARVAPEFMQFGEYDVSSINGINEQTDEIYFHSAAPQPINLNLFSLNLHNREAEPVCLTCSIANCTYSQSIISDNFEKAVVLCKGPVVPHAVVLDIEPPTQNFSNPQYKPLVNDSAFQTKCEELGTPMVIHETIQLDNGYEALTKLIMPQDVWIRDKAKAVPLLVHVYGGPTDQNTKDSREMSIPEYIMTNSQVAVLRIDGRGSGGRGWKYRSAIYGKLGTVEVEDQIKAIKMILQSYHVLDPQRVAVFGWSYGGFMSLSMVEQADEKFFKCAVSVAPVTNFAYYDATYTERYMGDTPIEMYSDVTRKLDNFRSTKLLLMHGLLDDNVHFQNSAILIDELQHAQIDFDLMVYPNQAHSITAKRSHVTQKIAKFIDQCFALV